VRLLVTGAKGQLGSAICRLAAGYPFEVVGLDSSELDITNRAAIKKSFDDFRPGFIVNAAAYTAVDKAETEQDKAELVNAVATGYLAELAALRKIPLLHVSTDYVYNGAKTEAYVETDRVQPLGVYGHSKLQGELLVQKHNARHIILRTSWVFGLEGKNFPKTMLRLAFENKTQIGVVADQMGCPTFADDIAKAALALVSEYEQTGALAWGVYHYAGQQPCSWYDFAAAVFERASRRGLIKNKPDLKPLKTAEYPTAAQRPANSVLNCQKFSAAFPRVALSDWQKGIDALITSLETVS
jgi:dTDP-4-dehydrorhamnose reductase